MKETKLLLFIFSILIVISCKKEKVPLTQLDNEFVIGEPELGIITVHVFEPNIEVWSDPTMGSRRDTIDLLGDGELDIVVETYAFHWANQFKSSIYSLHGNLTILCDPIKDTMWRTTQNINPFINNDSVMFNDYSGFTSGQTNDSVLETYTDYYPKKLEKGATGIIDDPNNVWNSSGLFSSYASGSHYLYPGFFLYIQKGNWVGAGEKYLCFRLEKDNKIRYGWLKLSIPGSSHIRVSEYAIQE